VQTFTKHYHILSTQNTWHSPAHTLIYLLLFTRTWYSACCISGMHKPHAAFGPKSLLYPALAAS